MTRRSPALVPRMAEHSSSIFAEMSKLAHEVGATAVLFIHVPDPLLLHFYFLFIVVILATIHLIFAIFAFLLVIFQLHSWELGTDIRVHRCILVLVQQSLKFGIILRNFVGPFVWLVPTIQEAKFAPLILSCSNRIDSPDYSSRHRHGRE